MDEELKEVLVSLINTVEELTNDMKEIRDNLQNMNVPVVQLGSEVMKLREENIRILLRVGEIERYLEI